MTLKPIQKQVYGILECHGNLTEVIRIMEKTRENDRKTNKNSKRERENENIVFAEMFCN